MIYSIQYNKIGCIEGAVATIRGEELVKGYMERIIQHQFKPCPICKKERSSGRYTTIILFQTDDLNRNSVSIAATFFIILMDIFLNDR